MRNILSLFILLLPFGIVAQTGEQSRKDSLRNVIAHSEGEEKINAYILLTNLYFVEAAGDDLKFTAVYEDLSGNYTSARGTVTVNVMRATGADVNEAPTLDSKTKNSITVEALTIPVNPGNQTVEYAISTSDSLSTSAVNVLSWQSEPRFIGLLRLLRSSQPRNDVVNRF